MTREHLFLDEICSHCGCTYGSHHGGRTENFQYNTCPSGEGTMDWAGGPGTTFLGTGTYKAELTEVLGNEHGEKD